MGIKRKIAVSLAALTLISAAAAACIYAVGGGSYTPDADEDDTRMSNAGSPAPSAAPVTPSATPPPSKAQTALADMSLREKVCQMFVTYPDKVQSLYEYPVGGFIFLADHLADGGESVKTRIQELQNASDVPLLICADEEGGSVNRLMRTLGTTYLGDMYGYKDEGEQKAFDNAAIIASDMQSFGFNTDFAPVADVWSNPDNTVIGRRAYSDDFEQAASLVAAAVRGFKSRGLICSVKHFPGHGDTAEDSHFESATVTKSLGELRQSEFLPFLAGIDAGADMVMIGHLTVTGLGSAPATVSYDIVTGLLRGELGYDGVVITDGLEMEAVTSLYPDGELCVLAVLAGIDILLGPGSLEQSVAAVVDAAETGRIPIERIDQSVLRILEMKERNGLL